MDFKDIWNELCYRISKKNQNAPEREFQIIAEELFAKIGWLQYKGEIITQKTIPLGSSNFGKPDIIISNGEKDLFVVELKKPSIQMIDKNAAQLFSYMRQLKLKFGILIGETLHIYYESSNDNKMPLKIIEIQFNENSKEGLQLLNILSKNEYSPEKLNKYCKDKIAEEEINNKVKEYLNKICSADGKNFIFDLLKQKIIEDFSEENTNFILENINIIISKKEINKPITDTLTSSTNNKPGKRKKGKNYDKYKLNGKWAGGTRQNSGKGQLALATVKLYKEMHPYITLEELNEVFGDIIGERIGFVDTYESASQKFKGQTKEERHFLDDPIELSNGQKIVVTTEWGPNIAKFIVRARELGFNIEIFEE